MTPKETGEYAETEIANIHLHVLGKERLFSVRFGMGPQKVGMLLPVAQELSNQITAVVLENVQAEGRSISCKAGCGACCRQLVAISLVEAQSLADLVASMPSEKQAVIRERFADAVRILEEAGLLGAEEAKGERHLRDLEAVQRTPSTKAVSHRYYKLQIPCPFLENDSCGIHPHRPLVCREYHVTSPAENCAHLYDVPVDRVDTPLQMSNVVLQTAQKVAGTEPYKIPLTLALEWAEAHPHSNQTEMDGLEMMRTMMGEIDKDFAKQFDSREN